MTKKQFRDVRPYCHHLVPLNGIEKVAETMNCKRYHVVVAMKPLVFDDDFARKPDKNSILQFLLDKLKDGELDKNFVVVVEAKKGG